LYFRSRKFKNCYEFGEVKYTLGLLDHVEYGISLSRGLSIERIAEKGKHVQFANRALSSMPFHDEPDGAAIFELEDGAYAYVSLTGCDDFCVCVHACMRACCINVRRSLKTLSISYL